MIADINDICRYYITMYTNYNVYFIQTTEEIFKNLVWEYISVNNVQKFKQAAFQCEKENGMNKFVF